MQLTHILEKLRKTKQYDIKSEKKVLYTITQDRKFLLKK